MLLMVLIGQGNGSGLKRRGFEKIKKLSVEKLYKYYIISTLKIKINKNIKNTLKKGKQLILELIFVQKKTTIQIHELLNGLLSDYKHKPGEEKI